MYNYAVFHKIVSIQTDIPQVTFFQPFGFLSLNRSSEEVSQKRKRETKLDDTVRLAIRRFCQKNFSDSMYFSLGSPGCNNSQAVEIRKNLNGEDVSRISLRIYLDKDECIVGDICSLYTDPDNRNKGYASDMLTTAHSLFEFVGCTKSCLDVMVNNVSAISLYHKLGYEIVSSDDDDHIMQKNLNQYPLQPFTTVSG